MTKPRKISKEELLPLRENLHLEGGCLYWKTTVGRNSKKGSRAGSLLPDGYRKVGLNGRYYQESRVVYYLNYGIWPGELQVDHINGNKSDNRPCNLRLLDNKKNGQSFKKSRGGLSSSYRGVYKFGNRYYAKIVVNSVKIHLGSFISEKEAALAFNYKALEVGFNPQAFNNVFGD